MAKKNETKLALTEEEKARGLNAEEIKGLLINKAILETAKKYDFNEEEKEEFEYFFKNEKNKFFIAKAIEDKISVNENDVTKLYTENKANFDAQNIPFSEAREIIQRDLLNQQLVTLEAEELNKLVEEMEDKVEITKDNVYINYYLDLEVRKNVKVTQEEIAEIYENEKAKLGNVTPNSAYQQIANALVNNRAIEERNKLIDKISEEYKIEEIAKVYTEAK